MTQPLVTPDPLPQSDELLSLLITSLRDYALIFLGTNGLILRWNAGAEELFGYQANEMIGQHIAHLFPLEDQQTERPQHELTQALRYGRLEDDNWLVRKDMSCFWANGLTMPLWDSDHHLRCFVKIVRDATAQKHIADAWHESEERFRTTFEQAAVGLAHVAPDGHWIRVNQKLCDIVGYDPDKLLQHTFQDITHPDDLPADLALVRQLLQGKRASYTLEKRYIRFNGSVVWVHLTVSLVRDASGSPNYFISVIEDITPRREVEQALSQAHQHTVDILESISDAFYAVDINWQFTYINHRAEQLWQLQRAALIGKRIWDVFPNAIGSEPYYAHQRAFQEQRPHTFEAISPIFHRWIEATIYPSAAGVSVYFRDITERKQAEEEREHLLAREQAARQQAEEAVRLRDAFFSIASHELKNPLTVLVGNAQLLERRVGQDLPEHEQRMLHLIVEQTHQLNRLIGHLLDLSLLESGQARLEREPLDVGGVVRHTLEVMESLLVQREVQFQDAGSATIVLGDMVRLEQVFRNLLHNALKYSPVSSPISITVMRTDNTACIAISDQGIGIPADAQAHLFERYYRAENVTTQHISGAGIGLYVVHEIVALHGGTVTVASAEGQGSTFTVSLPLFVLPSRYNHMKIET